MDVETASLNGKLDEEIYMKQPEGYVKPGEEHMAVGIKLFGNVLRKLVSLKPQQIVVCLSERRRYTLTINGVHVDDLIILAQNISEMKRVKDGLKLQFKMKDMGELHYYVGVCIIHDMENKEVHLHQGQYIEKVLENVGQTEAKPVSTPVDLNMKLQKMKVLADSSTRSYTSPLLGAYFMPLSQLVQTSLKQWKMCPSSVQVLYKVI